MPNLLDQLHVHGIVDRFFALLHDLIDSVHNRLNILSHVYFQIVFLICNFDQLLFVSARVSLNKQLDVWVGITGCGSLQRNSLFS